MPAGSDYIFCLQDKSNNFWKVDAAGNVSISAQPYFLDFSPAGWDEIAIQNVRNKRYWGIDRTVSIPLSYLNDGAKIMKYALYERGTEEHVYLVIAARRLNYTPGVSYGYWYKQIYRGEVDLSGFLHAGPRVTCATVEDGLPKYLKANENTDNEYPLNVADAINVKMDGINLHNRVENYVSDGLNPTPNYDRGNHAVALSITVEDAPYVGGKKAVDRVKFTDNASLFNSQAWFLNTSVAGNVTFDYDFTVTFNFPYGSISLNPAADMRIQVLQMSNTGVAINALDLFASGTADPNRFNNRTHRIQGTGSLPIVPGTFVFLIARSAASGPTGADSIQTTYSGGSAFFNYKYLYRHPTTYVKAFRGQYLLTQLIEKLTEGNYTGAVSAYLNTHRKKVFTCGNGLRGLDDAKMKISWSTFFQFWDCYDSVGIKDLANKVDIMAKKDMADYSNVIDLPQPILDTFKVSIAKEYLYNELDIGYPEISNEVGVLNGLQETNTKMLFSLGTTNSPAKIDKVSKIKSSPYEIEKTRIATFQKDTTDYKADNELFVLDIEDTLRPAGIGYPDHYQLDRLINATATGILEKDTIFNLGLSPKRNLKRNGPFLRSSMYKCDQLTLSFKTHDKNSEMICANVIEKADENLGGLGSQFFVPLLFDAEFPVEDELLALIEQDPSKAYRFPLNGELYYGLSLKGGVNPVQKTRQTFQLLSAPQNDFSKLVEFYG